MTSCCALIRPFRQAPRHFLEARRKPIAARGEDLLRRDPAILSEQVKRRRDVAQLDQERGYRTRAEAMQVLNAVAQAHHVQLAQYGRGGRHDRSDLGVRCGASGLKPLSDLGRGPSAGMRPKPDASRESVIPLPPREGRAVIHDPLLDQVVVSEELPKKLLDEELFGHKTCSIFFPVIEYRTEPDSVKG
jgi:hypothetical protein